MDLNRFPRRRYTQGATPLHHLERLSQSLGGPAIYIKRDDQLGLTGGGNKTRKLEFLVADALETGADTLITAGAVQSNHNRLTAAAANTEGLECHLILEERVPGSYDPDASGNNFLYKLLGVQTITVVPGGTDLDQAMEKVKEEQQRRGRRCYIIPPGGSSPIGATGYAACAQELHEQISEQALDLDHIICTSGSGGTHSGLLTGLHALGRTVPVTGICVRRPKQPQEEVVYDLAAQLAERLGTPQVPRSSVVCLDDYIGDGYSLPTQGMVEAVQTVARTEAILLDPVYTGKAMAGLIDLVRKGVFRPGQTVMFLHTGGSPALYAYQKTVLGED
jgi:D-cysteine desulfhydrase